MIHRHRAAAAAPVIIALAMASSLTGWLGQSPKSVPKPESVLGWKPCADYKLSTYEQITDYLRAVDKVSDRMKIVDLGKTSEGRTQIMAIVSSPENLKPEKLKKYAQISRDLSQVSVNDGKAQQLAKDGKTIAWVDFGIHATEVGPQQVAPQFAYDLVTSETPEAKSIRDNVITLLVPNVNPDGGTSVPKWYMDHVGGPYQDSTYPELYQKYSGHDNNRDWFMFNLPETRNLGQVLFHDWLPQLVYNAHQTASYPARIFIPPFKDPSNPNIPPEIIRGINSIGGDMTLRLDREGKEGAVSRQQYDGWWNGGLRSAPAFHNQVGILTETAHASATPAFNDPAKFPATFPYQGVSTKEPSAFYPSPYKGGEWHLSQSCAYIETTEWALLRAADLDREQWLYGSYRMGKQAIAAGGDTAYVIPADQADFPTATKMVNVLRKGNIRVEVAKSSFTVGNRQYPSGSFIVREAQPYRPDVVDLLNPQTYPDRRNPDGSPERPYDMAGWTLQYQMGVTVDKVNTKLNVKTAAVDTAAVPQSTIPAKAGYAYALDARQNDSFTAVNNLLQAGQKVTRTTQAVKTSLGEWPAGTFLIQSRTGTDAAVKQQALKLGITVAAVDTAPASTMSVSLPRVGLYHGYPGNADEGWTRLVLENFQFPYQRVHDKDVRTGNLRDKYDVIVLPDASYNSMLNGARAGSLPPEYTGGMTQAGVDNLVKFVQAGGKLVTVNDATELGIRAFGLPVTDVTSGVPNTSYYSPGSVVANTVQAGHPLTYGLPANLDVYSDGSPAFAVQAGAQNVTAPVSYPAGGLLRSGWLLGENVIANRSTVVDAKVGSGDVVLLGMSVQHRAEAHGTFKLLFNSLYLGGEH
ncbi:M14 family metallopeptidase [Dactylosporangium sp. CA-233914]|uniref:M14 family metallopeptidase n=1 Tax=Dactylosporangium sp. CA-233914 TaxID=3239934 RepID=UPI003D943C03